MEIRQRALGAIQFMYNRILRDRLPRTYGRYNGVVARHRRWLDLTDDDPDYKKGLIDAVHECVDRGDRVVVVGGGRGVSSVHCVLAGADEVIAYEPASKMLEVGRETVENAHVDSVEFRQATVGTPVEIYGDDAGATRLAPGELPEADAIILDCEGSELQIADEMPAYPAAIVETHPERDVAPKRVQQALEERKYTVTSRPYRPKGEHLSVGKRILVGIRS